MSGIELLLFDNDGVLVDTEHLFFRATAEVLARVGVRVSAADFARVSLMAGRSLLDLARPHGYGDDAVAELRAERNARYSELLALSNCVMPGVEETIRVLERRYRLGIVTSSRRDHFQIAHARSGILASFELVVALEDCAETKPHPAPYLTALGRAGVPAARALVIEDSPRGLHAARAAGVRCAVIPNPLSPAEEFAGADLRLASICELPAALAELGG